MTSKSNYKGAKVTSVVTVVCLLVLLSIGSVFFFSQAKSSKTSNNLATPTEKKATPTPTSTSTATPQPLFFDNFANMNKGWSLASVSGYTRMIDNNTLTLADANHKTLIESLPTSATFDDFMVSITFTLMQADQTDSVGLYLRGDSNLDHDYRIDIYGNKTYAIGKESLDIMKHPQLQFLVNPTSTLLLKPIGQQNTLTVTMNGANLIVQINGTMVNSVTDTEYTKGQIALFVQNSDTSNGVQASFSSIAVYALPDQLPPG